MGVFAELFPSNSHLFWLQNSGCQQTCDMYKPADKILRLIRHCVMKTCKVYGCKLHAYLMSPLDRGEWSASYFDCFILDKELPVLSSRGLSGLQICETLEAVKKRRFLSPSWGSHPLFLGCPARNLVSMPTELFRLHIYY
jgi:hypothetical protein